MADPGDWMGGWQNVAIMGTIMGAIIVGLLVWGIVAIVRAVAGRNKTVPGGRTCKSCGMMVNPGNTQCPTCKAQMDWS
ncbi:MAG: hypothetical protein V4510_06175 [bacterium]